MNNARFWNGFWCAAWLALAVYDMRLAITGSNWWYLATAALLFNASREYVKGTRGRHRWYRSAFWSVRKAKGES